MGGARLTLAKVALADGFFIAFRCWGCACRENDPGFVGILLHPAFDLSNPGDLPSVNTAAVDNKSVFSDFGFFELVKADRFPLERGGDPLRVALGETGFGFIDDDAIFHTSPHPLSLSYFSFEMVKS